jgi:hypothetical protein
MCLCAVDPVLPRDRTDKALLLSLGGVALRYPPLQQVGTIQRRDCEQPSFSRWHPPIVAPSLGDATGAAEREGTMATLQVSGVINRPVEDVWGVLSNPENAPIWSHNAVDEKLTSPRPVRVGTDATGGGQGVWWRNDRESCSLHRVRAESADRLADDLGAIAVPRCGGLHAGRRRDPHRLGVDPPAATPSAPGESDHRPVHEARDGA